MTYERVYKWFTRLPEGERDLPLIILNGIAYTPRMALNEVYRGSAIGQRIQALIESGRLGTNRSELEWLAKERLKIILRKFPAESPIIATLGGRVYTPEDLIKEVEAGTAVGRRLIESEINRMISLVRA